MYKVPKGEEGLMHIQLFKGPKFDPETGEANEGLILKTPPKQWSITKDHYARLGFRIGNILHDPNTKKTRRKPKTEPQEAPNEE